MKGCSVHKSSYNEMEKNLSRYLSGLPDGATVLDVGSLDVNGSYRQLIRPGLKYIGIDVFKGNNVDLVMRGYYDTGLDSNSVDAVISGQCLEHCRNPFRLVAEIKRVMKPGARCILAAPFHYAQHRFPIDCWRFLPDGMIRLFFVAGLQTIRSYINDPDCWGIAEKPLEYEYDQYSFVHDGNWFLLHTHAGNEQMFYHLRKEGTFFESIALDYIRSRYPDQKCILDVGANIGNHSLYFAHYFPDASVFAFEPHPKNYFLLMKNLDTYKNAVCYRTAVGKEKGEAYISTDHYNMGMCKISPNETEIIAERRTIDSYVFKDVSLIKIDTEGTELEIIEGAMRTIEACNPLLMIEIQPDDLSRYDAHMQNIGYGREIYWKEKIVGLYRRAA